MLKPSTRKIVAKPAKPATVKAAKPAQAGAALPAVIPAAPIEPATVVPAVAKPSANITRTAATVVRSATNFATLSDRDSAYLAFYAGIAKAAVLGNVTLGNIVLAGTRPNYLGSNKPHDAGVIVRLTKAGLIAPNADGHSFSFTATGKTHGAYTKA